MVLLGRLRYKRASRGQDRSAPPPSRASTGKVGASCRPGRGTPSTTRVAGSQDVAGRDQHQTEKRRKGARGRSHSARRADTFHQPHLGGVSETFRHASPTDVGYMLLLLLLFATVRKKQHEETHAARVTQSWCLSIRSARSHRGPELDSPSLLPGPPSLHRGDERGQCHEMSTSCGHGNEVRT